MAVIIIMFVVCSMMVLIGISACDAPVPTQTQKTTKKRNHNINTYGKYKQAKRYYSYSRGRKLW